MRRGARSRRCARGPQSPAGGGARLRALRRGVPRAARRLRRGARSALGGRARGGRVTGPARPARGGGGDRPPRPSGARELPDPPAHPRSGVSGRRRDRARGEGLSALGDRQPGLPAAGRAASAGPGDLDRRVSQRDRAAGDERALGSLGGLDLPRRTSRHRDARRRDERSFRRCSSGRAVAAARPTCWAGWPGASSRTRAPPPRRRCCRQASATPRTTSVRRRSSPTARSASSPTASTRRSRSWPPARARRYGRRTARRAPPIRPLLGRVRELFPPVDDPSARRIGEELGRLAQAFGAAAGTGAADLP